MKTPKNGEARSRRIREVRKKFRRIKATLDERQRRLWAAVEAEAIGRGGPTLVSEATGIARSTINEGRKDLRRGSPPDDLVRVRRRGAGPIPREEKTPELIGALLDLVEADTRGDPESPLRWSSKSTRALAQELSTMFEKISPQKVGRLLRMLGYSLQAPSKTLEGKDHPDRNSQFEYMNRKAKEFLAKGQPVLSSDTKKKELVGEFKTSGQEWRPKGEPIEVKTHDFIDQADGKAIPYGVFDVFNNVAVVNVGVDHDTPAFAVRSIELYWKRFGAKQYPHATDIFITCDAGGSNSYRSRVWKKHLQRLADKLQIAIHVSHFPPGTSKWNKIEHKVFSYISMNWRGRPLSTYETVINVISATKTSSGLRVTAMLDEAEYPLGETVSDEEMDSLVIEREEFHGDWNYTIRPRPPGSKPLSARRYRKRRASRPMKPPPRRSRSGWAEIQRRVDASKLSLAEFCRRNGLSYDAVRKQRSRLNALRKRSTYS